MIPNVRAWDKVNKEMIEDVASIHFKAEMIVTRNLCFYPFKDIERLQSTGLLDKNGTEIFEGHIVKDTDGYVGYIAFLKQEMGYVVVYKTYDKRLGHRYRLDDGRLEILGNIYQDKHLLGED